MDLKLPNGVASRQDVVLLHREVRMFLDAMNQSVMRHDSPIKYPAISTNLRAIATINQIDLRDAKKCEELIAKLEEVKDKAPSVHVSFPSEPSTAALERLIVWFRKEIDPKVVIQVGLQPTIAAGVVVRTPNHQFDFSLRKHLYENQHKLGEAIRNAY